MPLNVPLKMAILQSGRKQKRIAALTRIHVTRLSQIVRGRERATKNERDKLATVLKMSVADLFPDAPPAAAPDQSEAAAS